MLRRFLLLTGFCSMMIVADAQQLKTPAPSPTQTVKQDFALSSIELTYSRPASKGRKVFGDLVPYGKLWRTGANAASRIKFADDVQIGGTNVKAGEYVIYTVPGENEWEVVINKGLNNWGSDGYKQEEDVVRVKAKPTKLNDNVESFTMQFANVKPTSVDLQIMWEKTAVSMPITTEIDKKVMAQIDQLMKRDSRPYFNAAMYYLETGKDLNQAVTWFDKAIEQNPNAFWVYHQKANALAKMGKKEEARSTAQKSMEMAREQKNDDYVKLNEKLIASLK
jgi:tetratricopeptide (TPR) repeat protein